MNPETAATMDLG